MHNNKSIVWPGCFF